MGMLGIFVGKVLKLLWKGNAEERESQHMQMHVTEVMYSHVLCIS